MKYFSQIGQDKYYIEQISKGRTNGIFVDVGANDGLYENNTAALELFYNWRGLCIEANPFLIPTLKKNRPLSKVLNCAIWNKSGDIDLEITDTSCSKIRGNLLSRISSIDRNEHYFKNYFDNHKQTVKVKARPLTEILLENFGPRPIIDYMSLDIEGAEIEALKSIDFNIIDIKFMTIEHGDRPDYLNQISYLLESKGYTKHRKNLWDVEFIK